MADSDAEFEDGLRKDIPRGLKGREDNLPRTRWAEPDELLPKDWDYSTAGGGLFLGYRKGRTLGWKDDRHALTVAGTRAGKGASLIVPNLLLYPGSVLAIDPKGELARITGRRRKELGNKLVVLDPFGENGRWKSGQLQSSRRTRPEGQGGDRRGRRRRPGAGDLQRPGRSALDLGGARSAARADPDGADVGGEIPEPRYRARPADAHASGRWTRTQRLKT